MNSKRLRAVERLTAYDIRTLSWVLSRPAAARAARVARVISRLGDGPAYVVLGVALLLLEPLHGRAFLLRGLAAFALEMPLYLILKNTIRRPRPSDALESLSAFIRPSDRFSFPSGHTAAAFVMATLISGFYPAWAPVCYPLALMVGLSRVVLGVHFPSDILAGAVLGSVCGLMMIMLSF